MNSQSRIFLLTTVAASLHLQAQPRYIVEDLGQPGLGGATSFGFGINNAGRVAGQAALPDGAFRSFLSGVGRTLINNGTLGGPNSGASGLNFFDTVALISDTKTKDPNGEDYCVFGTNLICLAATWQDGVLTALPAVGGNNSFAEAINTFGQVAGFAENATQDATCNAPQGLRSQAAVWGPLPKQLQALPPLPGDTVSFALGINDLGEVVGASGTCAETPLAPFPFGPHAVLWQNGTPRDLGSLSPSGSALNVGASINNLGMVVGGSFTPNAIHTYLWTASGGMKDLGLLGNDLGNLPGAGVGGINNRGQVVGISCINDAFCDMGNPTFMGRAYLWQNGTMMDLNSLVTGGSPLYLLFACEINDLGEIVGYGLTAAGDVHAFQAHPLPSTAAHPDLLTVERVAAPMALSERARTVLQRRIPMRRSGY